ncbi:MAG: nuclear transport factor 2 family protein [Planctomycetes bacterium]|nr:nuclear transport factor 2 family protein [Planctomycetota bacterium]
MNRATHRIAKMSVIPVMLGVLLPILHAQEEVATTPEVDESAIPAQLDETRAAIFRLYNEEKYAEIAEQYCHEDIICLWNDGTTSKGREGVTEFFAKLKTFIDVLKCTPTTQDRSVFADGKYVVSIGEMGDSYEMADGKAFDLDSVWMATLAHDDGEWKLISFAVSTNAFENEVIDAYLFLRTLVAGGIGIVIGLVVALALTSLRKRKSS